jgi:hypothetical protein
MASIRDWGEAFEVAFCAYSLVFQDAPDAIWELREVKDTDIMTVCGEIKGDGATTIA